MANSSNRSTKNTDKSKKSNGGKITVSRETSGTAVKRSSTGRSTSGSGQTKNSGNRSASKASNGGKITVSREASGNAARRSSTGRGASGAGSTKSSTGRNSSGSNPPKSSTGRSSSASGQSRSSANRSVSSNGSRSSMNRSTSGANAGKNSIPKTTENSKRQQKQQKTKKLIVAAELIGILIFVVIGVTYFMNKKGNDAAPVDNIIGNDIQAVAITVDGIDVTMMTKEQAKQALVNKHPWGMQISFDGRQYDVENYYEKAIDAVLYDAFASRASADYTVNITNTEGIAGTIAKTVSDMWSQPAVDASITGYNPENGEFTLSDSQKGYIINVDKLTQKIAEELNNGNYTAQITAEGEISEPTFQKEDFKILGTYKTTTTKNENRNTNVRIACETICGTILQPQEQFSYNTILGRRTEEKGYKEAGAYANGEHVMEIGGGICQVSSTIYNAAIFAGLQIDKRTGHTYEPSYVTPGEDAAVSYSNPDFVFTNNSGAALGIKTTFQDRTIVATVFGVSILPEGVKQYMRSEKISDVPPPEDIYVEDPAIFPGQSQVAVWPKNGSRWKTYLIQEKDGQIISETDYHTTTYRGTAAEIHVNNSGTYNPTAAPPPAQPPAPQPTEPAPAPTETQPADTPPEDTPPAEPTEG